MKFTGLDQVLKHIETLEASHQAAMLEVAGETLVTLTKERFTLGVDPYGIAWKVSRRAQEQGGQTLRDKGILANSFTFEPISSDGLIYGTNVWYGEVHQKGWVIEPKKARALRWGAGKDAKFAKRVTIPARPMVPDDRGPPAPYDAELKATLEDALNGMIAQLGLNP